MAFTKRTLVNIDKEQRDLLKELAYNHGTTYTNIIRTLIQLYLDGYIILEFYPNYFKILYPGNVDGISGQFFSRKETHK